MEPICETTLFFAGLFMSELPWSDSKIWTETLFPHFLKKHIKCFKLIKLVSFRVYSLQARSLYLHYRLDILRHSKCMNQNIKPVTFQNTLKSWHFFTLWIFLSLKMPCFLSFLCNHKRQTTFFFFFAVEQFQELRYHWLLFSPSRMKYLWIWNNPRLATGKWELTAGWLAYR